MKTKSRVLYSHGFVSFEVRWNTGMKKVCYLAMWHPICVPTHWGWPVGGNPAASGSVGCVWMYSRDQASSDGSRKAAEDSPGGHSSGSYLLTPSRAPWNLKWGLAQSSQVWQTPRKVWNFLLNVRQKHISETMKKESPCQKACRVLTISVDFKKICGVWH